MFQKVRFRCLDPRVAEILKNYSRMYGDAFEVETYRSVRSDSGTTNQFVTLELPRARSSN
jgi:hypothetical protein